MSENIKHWEKIFQQNNGILRTAQAKKLGIDPKILARMTEAGILKKEGRGIYRLANLPPLSNPDLVNVALRVPSAVFCLISALSFHNLTTQLPYKIYIAIPQGTKKPKIDYPPIDVVKLSEEAFTSGIEEHTIDGVCIRVYNKEKTVADCFKFRNKIGTDIAIEAVKDYLRNSDANLEKLLHFARINRVEAVIRPYIEAVL
jgi:predicted transcriptional regulator of viral defense system